LNYHTGVPPERWNGVEHLGVDYQLFTDLENNAWNTFCVDYQFVAFFVLLNKGESARRFT